MNEQEARLFGAIRFSGELELSMGDLCRATGWGPQRVSRALSGLRRAGLVVSRRERRAQGGLDTLRVRLNRRRR